MTPPALAYCGQKMVLTMGSTLAGEIFLLLSAVLLHDIGRIGLEPGGVARAHQTGVCEDRKPLCRKEKEVKRRGLPCIKPYWEHHRRGRDIIEDHGLELGLPDAMAVRYCALLAYCHGLAAPLRGQPPSSTMVCRWRQAEDDRPDFRNTSVEPLGSVRIPLLAAILRIADETENHWTRALTERWLRLYRGDVSKAFRRRIEDVEFCHAGQYIVMHLATERRAVGNNQSAASKLQQEDENRFAETADNIRAVLDKWKEELQPLGIAFDDVLYETRGRLWSLTKANGKAVATNKSLSAVLTRDSARIETLVESMIQLSMTTMGHREFPWSSVEGKVGSPIGERDKWLVARMADWVPGAISVDDWNKRVIVNRDKYGEMRKELLGVET